MAAAGDRDLVLDGRAAASIVASLRPSQVWPPAITTGTARAREGKKVAREPHCRPKNQKKARDLGGAKMGPEPKSGIFPGNVRNVHGIIFSLLGNYLGPLKIQLSNYLFLCVWGYPHWVIFKLWSPMGPTGPIYLFI